MSTSIRLAMSPKARRISLMLGGRASQGVSNNSTRLSCRGAFDTPFDARPPSINEMRRALGDIASLLLVDMPVR